MNVRLGLAASLIAIGGFTSPLRAQAEEPAAADKERAALETIVVTATRRATNLQDVPQSITAFSEIQIEEQGIESIADFAAMTPNISVVEGFFGGDKPTIVFRGLGALAGAAPSVGILVDGVNLPAGEPLRNRMFDLERIEVVRGPQAALYGRDTIGGVINIITRKPTNAFEARLDTSYGSADTFTIDGAISGAIVEDKLKGRLSGSYLTSDGFFRNFGGFRQDYREEASVRGQLRWEASETVKVDLYAGHLDVHNGYNGVFFNFDSDDRYIQDNGGVLANEDPGFNKRTNSDVAARIEADLGFAELTSITQYQRIHTELDLDGDFGLIRLGGIVAPPITAIGVTSDLLTRDFSEDLRLVSRSDRALRWIVGAFFATQRRFLELNTDTHIGALVINTPSASDFKDTNWSVYGQLEYDLTDALTVSGAMRYSADRHRHSLAIDPLTEDTVTPQFVVSYDITPDLLLYGSYAEGYRSGGYDVNTGNPYLSEHTSNWEIGARSSWFDRQLTANIAAYAIDYTNQQITTIVTLPSGALAGGTANVGETELAGVEFELAASPVRNLLFSATASYSDTNVTEGEPKYVGFPLPYDIPFQSSLAGQYTFELGEDVELMTRAEWSYLSGKHWGTSISPVTGMRRVLEERAYSLVGLRARLTYRNLAFAAGVENLFNTRYNDQLFPDLVPGGWHGSYPGLPRRFTFETSVRF